MRALPSPLRKRLEVSVVAARRAAEGASRAAVEGLGVFVERRPEHLDEGRAALRVGLRAKWRQLGGERELLVSECAYEQWHRLLFARFLAENGLLLHPQFGAPVTLAECGELAAELGEPDAWSVAARFAAEILPGIFRLDDPCVRVRLAPEGRYALEQILDGIQAEAFVADDALGWVYQFWQKDKKDEVNASERKIGGADLGPVTQLFTENYMVRFLLENSLGAWWAARHPESRLVTGFEYLRFDDDGNPAAGSFDGWPDRVAEVTVMDPCCGSGHFLVEAFSMLWQMRAEEEGLAPVDAQDAVLRDNLFGLELDPRCVQIAMFAVALQAWKAGGGWRQLPLPNIACSGIPVKAPVEEWTALAGGDQRLENALERLHILFQDADTLGSLIDPRRAVETTDPGRQQQSLRDAPWEEVAPLLADLVAASSDPGATVAGSTASSLAQAAHLLSRRYGVVVTNVPYLTGKAMGPVLAEFCKRLYPRSRSDLAAVMLERCRDLTNPGGSFVLVTTQNWLSLSSYRRLRETLLSSCGWNVLARLGTRAFETITGDVVQPVLTIHSRTAGPDTFLAVDCSAVAGIGAKAECLQHEHAMQLSCLQQLAHPDSRIILGQSSVGPLLNEFAKSYAGIQSGDYSRFGRFFWELPALLSGWGFQQSTTSVTQPFGGREHIFFWEDGRGSFYRFVCERLGATGVGAWIRGAEAWGKRGIAVRQMGDLPVTLYTGELTDNNVAMVIASSEDDLPAIWAYCQSDEYARQVRLLDQKMNVTNTTLVKVPFDAQRWRQVAAEEYPDGLPEPWSDDPTQWLFEGRPEVSTAPLQVAVGRLVGYRWPEQAEFDELDSFADPDGIVCLPAVAGEPPAADRVQDVLAAAFGEAWSPAKLNELLERSASKKKNLADWLRDEFFKHHCGLFGNRPFVWHIWDGLRDGFSALVNYHLLDRKTLEKLTYTYLGQDWVERQRAEVRDEVAGAEARLSAALGLQRRLEAILEGEAPLDIYVRWKQLDEQPIGWEPDVNDGVRLNARPFVEAGVLRASFNVHWRKDRGKNPDGRERHNDIHLTLTQKHQARTQAGHP